MDMKEVLIYLWAQKVWETNVLPRLALRMLLKCTTRMVFVLQIQELIAGKWPHNVSAGRLGLHGFNQYSMYLQPPHDSLSPRPTWSTSQCRSPRMRGDFTVLLGKRQSKKGANSPSNADTSRKTQSFRSSVPGCPRYQTCH